MRRNSERSRAQYCRFDDQDEENGPLLSEYGSEIASKRKARNPIKRYFFAGVCFWFVLLSVSYLFGRSLYWGYKQPSSDELVQVGTVHDEDLVPAQSSSSDPEDGTKGIVTVSREPSAPQLWCLGLRSDRNQETYFQDKVDFQSLKHNIPSTTISMQKIQAIENDGCQAADHEMAMGKVAIVQDGSSDCDLWTIAHLSEKAGASAVLFYHSYISTENDLALLSSLLAQEWKQGDISVSIPVLSITRSLGVTLLKHQSDVLVSLITIEIFKDKPIEDGSVDIVDRILVLLKQFWEFLTGLFGSKPIGDDTPADGNKPVGDDEPIGDDPTEDGGDGTSIIDKVLALCKQLWEFLSGFSPLLGCLWTVKYQLMLGSLIGAVLLPVAFVLFPVVLGFGVEGIYAGSCAATCMACHGGYTPAGGFVAVMQSFGALGIYAGLNLFTVAIGAIAGLIGGGYYGITVLDMCAPPPL